MSAIMKVLTAPCKLSKNPLLQGIESFCSAILGNLEPFASLNGHNFSSDSPIMLILRFLKA